MSQAEHRSEIATCVSPAATDVSRRGDALRYPLLDVVRVAAMLDVVSIHVAGEYLFWGAGVPAFIVMSIALAVRKPEPQTLRILVPRRAGRVLVPWLVWSVVFGVSGLVSTLSNPAVATAEALYPWMALAGTRIHLWFLPFIFVAEVVAVSAIRPLRRVRTAVTVGGAVALALGLLSATGWVYDRYAPGYEGMSMASSDPQEQAQFFGWMVRRCWLYGTVSLCLGVALGRTLSAVGTGGLRGLWGVSLAMLVVAAVLGYTAVPSGGTGWGVSESVAAQWLAQATAFAAVTTGFQLTGRGSVRLDRVAALTMGVYLLHKWVDLRLTDALLIPWAGPWAAKTPWLTDGLGRVVLAWTVTTVLVAALRRWEVMKRVL